ncbi:MAG: hypothetical protein ABII27_05120 [bacterium]
MIYKKYTVPEQQNNYQTKPVEPVESKKPEIIEDLSQMDNFSPLI